LPPWRVCLTMQVMTAISHISSTDVFTTTGSRVDNPVPLRSLTVYMRESCVLNQSGSVRKLFVSTVVVGRPFMTDRDGRRPTTVELPIETFKALTVRKQTRTSRSGSYLTRVHGCSSALMRPLSRASHDRNQIEKQIKPNQDRLQKLTQHANEPSTNWLDCRNRDNLSRIFHRHL